MLNKDVPAALAPLPTARPVEAGYRADIDGLRAVSIAAVIASHMNPHLFPGGYLGVDLFFVISGYVITASLARRRDGTLRAFLLGFAARRALRLAPAFLTCVVVTGLGVCLLVAHPGISYRTGIASVFGISNIWLYFHQIDYFAPTRDLNVFLQTWSLGVEEQFYVLFPFLFWFTGAAASRGMSRRFAGVMSGLAIASLTAFLLIGARDPQAAYYLMPLRFWELAAGALLYVSERNRSAPSPESGASLLAQGAFLGLIGLVLLAPSGHLAAIVASVLCSVVIIRFGLSSVWLGRLLTHPLSVYIGLISYPLYLWHWSVISLSRWTVGMSAALAPIQIALMLALAAATYAYVERPVRHAMARQTSGRTLLVWSASVGLCALGIAALSKISTALEPAWKTREVIARYLGQALDTRELRVPLNPYCVVDDHKRQLQADTVDRCTTPPKRPGIPTLWTLGDSHAGHLRSLLIETHRLLGLGYHLVETPGASFPMLPGKEFEPRRRIFAEIDRRLRPGDIVVVTRLYLRRGYPNAPFKDLQPWQNELVKLATSLKEKGVAVVVVGPPPMLAFDTLGACRVLEGSRSSCDRSRAELAPLVDAVHGLLEAAARESGNVHIFELFNRLCPPDEVTCRLMRGGTSLYRDRDHLSARGAASLAGDFLTFLKARKLLSDF